MHEQDQCYVKQMQVESCKHVYVLLQQYHLCVLLKLFRCLNLQHSPVVKYG